MKLSSVFIAGAALAVGADAQMPPWLVSMLSSRLPAIPTGRPTGIPGPPGAPSVASPVSPSPPAVSGKPAAIANPDIPIGQTRTEVATALGPLKNIIPTIPTATFVPVGPSAGPPAGPPAGAGSASNSTGGTSGGQSNSTSTNTAASNGTIVSCADDAKKNPNAANDATHRCNWSPGFDINTDWYSSWPKTGKTASYTLTITNSTVGGKVGFLVNGQSPGPAIQANWGDTIQVTVVNKLQNNGTSIHFHGITMNNNNPSDGVGGVTQCPIAPGDSATYTFTATQYGTSWYHSHFSGQYGDGVLGPIVINGPTSANYDVDLGTVMITDDFPLTAFQESWLTTRFGPQTAQNYLLNGQNAKVDGSSGSRARWSFQPGKRHKIRFVNAATDSHYKVQIDQHNLVVVASDFVPINPYTTKELSIAIGQRYEVIVEANQATSNYWLRALKATDCSFNLNDGMGTANGVIAYNGANGGLPTSKLTTTHNDACVDEPLSVLVPVVAKTVDSANLAGAGVSLGIGANTLRTNNDTVFQWTLGGVSQVIDWSNPTLSNAVASNNNYDITKHVVQLTKPNAWTYWIIQNQFFAPHPIHLHGHDFYILAQGSGTFSGASANFVNPARRDTVMVTGRGYAVIAFKTDNPGAWLMHCHISWHAGGGLSVQFLEQPSAVPSAYGATVQSSSYQNTCSKWKAYASNMYYKQSDSGLKRREIVGSVDMEMEVMDAIPERRRSEHLKEHARRAVQHS